MNQIQIEQTLTSLEVAGMVKKEHKNLMRDINRYCKQINESNIELREELKIELGDFFTESTYQDANNQTRPCYNITKKGCEFIAHKLTGTKGTAFTARYINRFHEMEQALQQQPVQTEVTQKEKLLLKNSRTWFNKNNWKMKMICDYFDWERKYLYHKILREISDIYDLDGIEVMYTKELGHEPRYKMELLEFYLPARKTAERYINFLLTEVEEVEE